METPNRIGSHPISHITRKALCQDILDTRARILSGENVLPKLVFSANGQGLSYYATHPEFAADIDQADFVHADGQSLVLMSKLLPMEDLPERICTTDFFHDVAQLAQINQLRFFFLGGTQSLLDDLCHELHKMYPALEIVGTHHGYFTEDDLPALIEEINQSKPDILWVGLGRPLQERFCVSQRQNLQGITWLKTCGGLYNYITNREARAPLWMQNCGLEWLFRLLNDPKRLLGRYAKTNIHALYLMLRHFRGAK